jgi:nucleoid DNA-binding protein
VKIRNETDILIADIADSVSKDRRRRLCYNPSIMIRIIGAYLKIVIQTLLNGFSFSIPNLGTFDIHKQIAPEAHENIHKSKNELKPVYDGSFRKIGYRYWVMFESRSINTELIKFVPTETFVSSIIKLVNNSDHDFKAVTPCQ